MTAIETEALTAMIYIFIAFAIGLAVFDQYRKLKAEFFRRKGEKANEQTNNQAIRQGPTQEDSNTCSKCNFCKCHSCKCGHQCKPKPRKRDNKTSSRINLSHKRNGRSDKLDNGNSDTKVS